MVIAEINDAFEPVMDGVGNVVKNYAVYLNSYGNETHVLVPGSKGCRQYDAEHNLDYVIRGRLIRIKGMGPYGIVYYPPSTREKILSVNYDIVHSHSPFFAGSFALQIAKKQNIPLVSTFHTFFQDDIYAVTKSKTVTSLFMKGIMGFYKKNDEVWVPSLGVKKLLREEYSYDGELRVVENGCDMEVPSEQELAELRETGLKAIGCDKDTPVLLFVGQQKDEKNIPLILESLVHLKAKGCVFKMIFIGDGPHKKKYEEFVAQHDIGDMVLFTGKITDRSVLKRYYAASYLFLFPSHYDTFGIVKLEAAAFSVPTVFVENTCAAEGIIDNETGFIGKNTPEDFADKIVSLLNNRSLRDHAGKGARQKVYRSWHDVCTEVQELYGNLIEKKKSGR